MFLQTVTEFQVVKLFATFGMNRACVDMCGCAPGKIVNYLCF